MALAGASSLVHLLRVIEVLQYLPPNSFAVLDASYGVSELKSQTLSFSTNGFQSFGKLGFGPVRIERQFDVPIFLALQLLQLLVDRVPPLLIFQLADQRRIVEQFQQLAS